MVDRCIFTLWAKDAHVDSESVMLMLMLQRAALSLQPRVGSSFWAGACCPLQQGWQGRLADFSPLPVGLETQTAGQATWQRAREGWGSGAELGSEARGDRWPGGCVGRRAPSHTFWASLNCCRNAHLDTSFCRTGRKRNNGGWGKGRERRTPTHKPKLIPGIYCEITAKVLWAPLSPLAKDKCKVSLSVALSSSYTTFRRCFVKHREQKIQIPKPEY